MTQHTQWTDEAINNRIEEMLERDVWSEQDFGRVIATDIRDDMAQEIAALKAENAELKTELAGYIAEKIEDVNEFVADNGVDYIDAYGVQVAQLRSRYQQLTGSEYGDS